APRPARCARLHLRLDAHDARCHRTLSRIRKDRHSMTATAPVTRPDRFFIGGEWVEPSSDATIDVIDSGTEELFFRVAEAQADDIARAVSAARAAFDEGPWPSLTHAERAEYLRAFGPKFEERSDAFAQIWPRESGTIHAVAQYASRTMKKDFDTYAGLADTFT